MDVALITTTVRLVVAALAAIALIVTLARPHKRALHIYWAVFCGAISLTMLRYALPISPEWVSNLMRIASGATCGGFWLVARCLFRPGNPIKLHHLLLVGAVMAGIAVDITLPALIDPDGVVGMHAGIWQFVTLVSSTAIVLAFWEGVQGWPARTQRNEVQLRYLYLAIFSLCATVCTVLPEPNAAAAANARLLEACSALAILSVTSVAVAFRLRNPLLTPAAEKPVATAQDHALARRLERLMHDEKPYLEPELKVADLARCLHTPDYKVSRAITAGLQQANFNRYVNALRVAHAKALLRDSRSATRSILLIALDSGFASLGPFNRAFKADTGMTPRAWRSAGSDAASQPTPGPVATARATS
ncbi:helix-turn-helix domain-containing protein [Maricaulis salignorans]|uniref:AraC-type DNA-binding protein n=1 Tax=Maricaulis salignorans TaxID=144026 RepID=A0A1G9UI49_9PROT|nr:AraC family transcriptional regulator [Maricaulis salignorans]SDM59600.1 AraC-type DNA-binding protein [Maricaulis salignorans]